MKTAQWSWKGFTAFMVVFVLIFYGAAYLFLRVLEWNFFLSQLLAALVAACPAFIVSVAVEKKNTGQ